MQVVAVVVVVVILATAAGLGDEGFMTRCSADIMLATDLEASAAFETALGACDAPIAADAVGMSALLTSGNDAGTELGVPEKATGL